MDIDNQNKIPFRFFLNQVLAIWAFVGLTVGVYIYIIYSYI